MNSNNVFGGYVGEGEGYQQQEQQQQQQQQQVRVVSMVHLIVGFDKQNNFIVEHVIGFAKKEYWHICMSRSYITSIIILSQSNLNIN